MKHLVLTLIKVFQMSRIIRPPACRFYPSCSTYAQQAIERHGLVKGVILGAWRLLRCQPLNPGGIDEVPQAN